jgi:hypothetical protein
MNLKRKYVKNFRAFISEQEAAPMAGAEGAAPAEPTVEDKIFFFVTDKNKVEDFIEIIKGKEILDTMPEKKYVSVFKEKVKTGEIGKPEGSVEIEFDDKGEAYTDKLDINFIYYE